MSCRPDILVFDEPTTALDVTTQIEVLALVKDVVREFGTAALYISHDLAVVAQVADRIMVLRHGRMVEVGETDAILHAPREPYTKALVTGRAKADRAAQHLTEKTAASALQIAGLDAWYGKFHALKAIDLEVHAGETLAVVGESGSGKTTLARVVAGLMAPAAGVVQLASRPLAPDFRRRPREDLRRIQLIYQQPDIALNPRQTVADIIGRPIEFYFSRSKDQVRNRVVQLLAEVGLPGDYASRPSTQLSGGEKQRVCIARALAAEPDLLICDEPTSALDQLVAEDILMLLGDLQKSLGLTYLFITHDLGVVRRIAHRTAVMLKGEIVAQGPTAEIFAPPFHPYTERLIASVPEMRSNWLAEALAKRASQNDGTVSQLSIAKI